MKIGFYSAFETQMQNRMFLDPNAQIGDNLLLPLVRLKQAAQEVGIDCQTADMAGLDEFDAFVFCEIPPRTDQVLQYARDAGKPAFLTIAENYFIHKGNADRDRYREFDAVFTYDDQAVDGEHVFKMNYAFDLPCSINTSVDHKQKFAVMICGNKKKDKKNLLYGKRRQTIRWFEKHHPDEFDLYGFGWGRGTDAFQSCPPLHRVLRNTGLSKLLPRRTYPSWKGGVERKSQVLGQYRFGFCYENTDQIPGYITEKIFDVMLAGTVPVYLGPSNTGSYIPKECFINIMDFDSHESLYLYLTGMSDSVYQQYLKNIYDYLSTNKSEAFSITTYVKTIISVFEQYRKVSTCLL